MMMKTKNYLLIILFILVPIFGSCGGGAPGVAADPTPEGTPNPPPDDSDYDNDEIVYAKDNCPNIANQDQADMDGDGVGDACDSDKDGDGVFDIEDNCPVNANTDQADTDQDGMGDACLQLDEGVVLKGIVDGKDIELSSTDILMDVTVADENFNNIIDAGDRLGIDQDTPLSFADSNFYLSLYIYFYEVTSIEINKGNAIDTGFLMLRYPDDEFAAFYNIQFGSVIFTTFATPGDGQKTEGSFSIILEGANNRITGRFSASPKLEICCYAD